MYSKQWIEDAKADVIRAEKAKRAARMPELTVGNYNEYHKNDGKDLSDIDGTLPCGH